MFEDKERSILTAISSPFDLSGSLEIQANALYTSHKRFLEKNPIPDLKQRAESYAVLDDWLKNPHSSMAVTWWMSEFVKFVQRNERGLLSESHDLFHSAEMVTSFLDDKRRGIHTGNVEILLTAAFALTHDIGRTIEKKVTQNQLDLTTNLHHDVLSFQSTIKILKAISNSLPVSPEVKKSFAGLLLSTIHYATDTGLEPFIAIPTDTDRRQLLGSPTVARDILYFGGMQKKDLSPSSILWPPLGYTHYDSGGFFGQQDALSRNVYRDRSIRESRKLDLVYDHLGTEAMTIMLLACGNDQDLRRQIEYVNQLAPGDTIIDGANRPWWPKKQLPSSILETAEMNKQMVERLNPVRYIPTQLFINTLTAFINTYGTIVETDHLEQVKDTAERFSAEDRIAWERILRFAHIQNTQRHSSRRYVLDQELRDGTFLGKITRPFVEILESRRFFRDVIYLLRKL